VVNANAVDAEQTPNYIDDANVDMDEAEEAYFSSRGVLKKKKVFIFYLMSRSLQLFLSYIKF